MVYTDQHLDTLQFTEYNAVPTNYNAATEFRSTYNPETNKYTTEYWFNSNPAAVRNVHRITVADPDSSTPAMPDEGVYVVEISDGTTTEKFLHEFSSGDTPAQIAAAIAQRATTHPGAEAKVDATNTDQVLITCRIPGLTLSLTVSAYDSTDKSAVAGALSVAEVTAASGTAKFRKMCQVELTPSFEEAKDPLKTQTPKMTADIIWYDGADPANPKNPSSLPSKSTVSFAAFRAVA